MSLLFQRWLCRPKFIAQKPNRPLFRSFALNQPKRNIRYVRSGSGPEGPQGPQKPQHPLDYRTWNPRAKFMAIFVGLGTIYYVSHLEQVPETGRWRFMNVGPKVEAMIGESLKKEINESLGPRILPQNHTVTRHVRRVVSRILNASNLGVIQGEEKLPDPFLGLDGFGGFGGFSTPDSDLGATTKPGEAYGPQKEWDVIVVNNKKMINAMAAPGVVIVFTGILPVCQDEEGLAAVLAHEIGHVVARHTAERLASQLIWVGLQVILAALGMDYFFSRNLTTFLYDLPNSRKQEREADLIGLRLMSRACYNPEAAPAMFERLGKLEDSIISRAGFEFARTHPRSENRVKYLEAALPEAYNIVAENPECGQVRKQLDAFRETAHGIKIDEMGTVQLV